jgi:hypothetical protein
MKKWLYVISVGSMLAIFLVFYLSETKKHDERERQRAVEVAAKKKAEDERKAGIEAAARADAEKRANQRLADEAKKEADRVAKWAAEGQRIKDATDKANADADVSAKKAAQLELELSTLRTEKEKLNREAFELAKQVELGKIKRRTAELEIQRITAMISAKAAQSSLARP